MLLMGKIRIIGGQWRSRLLQFSDDKLLLRPTPDRVRETLFNWLGQDLTGKTCLDLFAGSGALGFEAASRGAKQVTMIEQNVKTTRNLRNAIEKLAASQVKLEHTDARTFLASNSEYYDIIFVDPPYQSGLLTEVLPLLPARLRKNGVVYAESSDKLLPDNTWLICKQGRASHVYYCLLTLNLDG
ncbi:16S rRNA (guanine(966)-N(2))-methyltransferase RsmD [Nitrosomonas eutropha]|uniref:16S rRNA (Guanine966-N2)-methyltransferase n=2 Tax=Nitrosomonas eutropha TaxID=916 RepID=A0ABX5M3F7_9PROT|nr:16S rRNA (guanine(966)-N(2))-methyltransferase RsmD [Nitrosomonas eutropha]ABI60559.1 putative methyltransferase [Nitrosomonas eutropha C91]PXV73830.1 16S rRNA (guanine966-N2)-methyltransferase [Nitrosomonas eutropha]SCX28934.1 16S rRNA (guanine966-N2)-methyltransferase [Nitrosomonas eutropha]